MGDGHESQDRGFLDKRDARRSEGAKERERAQRCGLTLNLFLTGVRMRWMDPLDDRASVDEQGCGIRVKGVQVGIGDVDNSRI